MSKYGRCLAADRDIGLLLTALPPGLAIEFAQRADVAGFRTAWFPEITFGDSFGPATAAALQTKKIGIATGVQRDAVVEGFYGSSGSALQGAGASRGVAEGIARVVTGADDFSRVVSGDVLVTTTTTPAWTPLFPSLGGLVTETGGILSHAAVVAREYGLPAVVGAAGATRAIADGARIRVDGEAGTVTILALPRASGSA